MHSTNIRPSLSERCCELPCMPLPQPRLRRLLGVFVPVLHAILLALPVLFVREQWQRVRRKHKAALVASRFDRDLHAS